MSTKTEIKTAQIPDDVKKYVDIVLDTLRRALESDNFTILVSYDTIRVNVSDIKTYVDSKKIYIIYKDIDIVYSDYIAIVKVWKSPYIEPEIYKAHDYWTVLDELHDLAIKKVKERLEKVLEKI